MLPIVAVGSTWVAFLRTGRVFLGEELPAEGSAIPWLAKRPLKAIAPRKAGTGPS